MPPKQQLKADLAKKQKIVEDKTFGLKNKNKSKSVQKYVQSLKQSVQPKPDATKINAQKKKEEELAREKELNELLKVAIRQPKVPVGVDPKSILCEHFKLGQCAKGFKCKFSHDLNVQRKGEKIDIYSDKRDQEDGKETMEDWDQETLEKVVESKSNEYNKNKPTDIVCKHFLEAVEKKQYGWFWVCPNGGKECHYRHALPPGYVLKSQMKALLEEEAEKLTIEEEIENQRAKVSTTTPMTPELFMQWRQKKMEEREAGLAAQRAERAKNDRMSGRELFLSDSSLFVDDAEAYDKYQREEDPDPDPEQKVNKDQAMDGPSSSTTQDTRDNPEHDNDNGYDDDEDDDDLDMDELMELEASLSRTTLQIREPVDNARS
ncbi:zinc finger CCCH domain-containing protein 21-like isoform X1 [Primulina tabacum]|uniref:zinc finger CCCH domain-containing protein 21-like isoform X1 n=1 Tax=Primulina tabacum TaxID=48773 RepID=UPI003F5A183A